MTKKDQPKAQTFNPQYNGRLTGIEPILDYLSGKGDASNYSGFDGAEVSVKAVVVRTYPADPYKLYIKAGEEWKYICNYPQDNPAVKKLKMTLSSDLSSEGKG